MLLKIAAGRCAGRERGRGVGGGWGVSVGAEGNRGEDIRVDFCVF